MMMNLKEWLAAQKLTQVAFADRVGVPQSSVSRWCTGEAIPSPKHIKRIARETDGQVGPASWFPDDEAAA